MFSQLSGAEALFHHSDKISSFYFCKMSTSVKTVGTAVKQLTDQKTALIVERAKDFRTSLNDFS